MKSKNELWQDRCDDLDSVQDTVIESPIVEASETIGDNNRVLLKCEQYQTIKSFKIRGATLAIKLELDELRRRGVVADSGGNHSQAVAHAGDVLDVPANIIMASVVPENKVEATRGFGAKDGSFHLDNTPADFIDAKKKAKAAAGWDENENLPNDPENYPKYLSPYDDPGVLRGQATVATEMLRQLRSMGETIPDGVHIPIGGGGLIGGVADVNAEQGHLFNLYGHEIFGADSGYESLKAVRDYGANEPQPVVGDVNLDAEGLAVQTIGNEAFARIRDGKIDEIYVVQKLEEMAHAYKWYIEKVMPELGIDTTNKNEVWDNMPEVSSMVAISGLFKHVKNTKAKNETHLVVISGRNTDQESFRHVMESANLDADDYIPHESQ